MLASDYIALMTFMVENYETFQPNSEVHKSTLGMNINSVDQLPIL